MEETRGSRPLILESALNLFSERGYEAVGVSEICAAAGVTKPTLYHFFGSKRGLLDTIVEERGNPFLASVREAAHYRGEVKLGLEATIGAFAAFAAADPAFARMRLALCFAPPSSEGGEAAASLNIALFSAIEAFFRDAARDHGNMRDRQAAFAVSFMGTADSYVGYFLNGRLVLGETVLREAVRQFMHGIFS